MAISKSMRVALQALSYFERDVTKTYAVRRKLDTLAAGLRRKPPGFSMWDREITCHFDCDHDVPVRLFVPEERTSQSALLFFHGGGWVIGNIDSYTPLCTQLALHTGCVVASVDYRLAPEHPFPAALEDCYAACLEAFEAGILGVDPQRVVLMGDSAGGNLAASVSLLARDRGTFRVPRQILVYPATAANHSESSPFESVHEFGEGYLLTAQSVVDYMKMYSSSPRDFENKYFAPLLETDLSGQPQTLVITAQYDPLRDEGELYGKRLQEAGNPCEVHRMEDGLHGYLSLPPSFPIVADTFAIISRFLEATTA